MLAGVIQLAGVGALALLIGFGGQPTALALGTCWLALMLATALVAGQALGGGRAARVAGEAVLALAALQALWPAATPGAAYPPARTGETSGVSWRLVFSAEEQALMKLMALPDGWEQYAVYLRIDLGSDYKGDGAFRLEVNHQDLGEVSQRTAAGHVGTVGIPSWSVRVPRALLASAPYATVVIRPLRLDSRLAISGHADWRPEALGRLNSWMYDGRQWSTDSLAGPLAGRAQGTYRVWLYRNLGEPA